MRVHSRTHTTMVEGGPNKILSLIPCGENGSLLPHTTGKVMAAQASFHSIHLSLVCEREIKLQDDMDCS